MLYERRNQRRRFVGEEEKQSATFPHHASLSLPPSGKEELASSSQLSGVRAIILCVVVLVVTLSMLASMLFLFTDGHPRLPLLFLPSSWSLPGLIGVGGGVVALLWVTLTSLLTGAFKQRSAQPKVSFAPPDRATRGAMTPLPPEPRARRTDELSAVPRDHWGFPTWEGDVRRQTEPLEAQHMRQRLRTLRLSYEDDFLEEEEKNAFFQIRDLKQGARFQRTTEALGTRDGRVDFWS